VLHGAPGHVGRADEVDAQGLLPRVLPLLVGHLGDRVPQVDPGVVHQHIQAAEVSGGRVDHPPDGLGVRQVGLDDGVAAARQPGPYVLGQSGRIAVVHRDPVAELGECLRDRPADAP
jgi:hypothetical protein